MCHAGFDHDTRQNKGGGGGVAGIATVSVDPLPSGPGASYATCRALVCSTGGVP
jgi:hypothetical protein